LDIQEICLNPIHHLPAYVAKPQAGSVNAPQIHASNAGLGLHLPAGDSLFEAGSHSLSGWRLLSGALRIDLTSEGRDRFIQIALPGDLVGLDAMAGKPHTMRARALLDCRLQPLPAGMPEAYLCQLLSEGVAQQWDRAADMAALRSGAVPERVKRLLLMLREPRQTADGTVYCNDAHALPRIKEIATMVDIAHETVSRILSGLRRLQLLEERHAGFARFDAGLLARSALPHGMTSSTLAIGS
jgi:CRP-like cAMP-binding protein